MWHSCYRVVMKLLKIIGFCRFVVRPLNDAWGEGSYLVSRNTFLFVSGRTLDTNSGEHTHIIFSLQKILDRIWITVFVDKDQHHFRVYFGKIYDTRGAGGDEIKVKLKVLNWKRWCSTDVTVSCENREPGIKRLKEVSVHNCRKQDEALTGMRWCTKADDDVVATLMFGHSNKSCL